MAFRPPYPLGKPSGRVPWARTSRSLRSDMSVADRASLSKMPRGLRSDLSVADRACFPTRPAIGRLRPCLRSALSVADRGPGVNMATG